MTEEEKQQMMAMMLRKRQHADGPGGQMIPLQAKGSPNAAYSSFQGAPAQASGGLSPAAMAKHAKKPAVSNNASGEAMSDTSRKPTKPQPTGPGSMAKSTPAAEMAPAPAKAAPVAMPAAVGGKLNFWEEWLR